MKRVMNGIKIKPGSDVITSVTDIDYLETLLIKISKIVSQKKKANKLLKDSCGHQQYLMYGTDEQIQSLDVSVIDIIRFEFNSIYNNDPYTICAHFATLSCWLLAGKYRVTKTYSTELKEDRSVNDLVVGITVGDLLKHHYYKYKDQLEKMVFGKDDDDDKDDYSKIKSKKERDDFLKFLRKSLLVSTYSGGIPNMYDSIGFRGSYSSYVHEWKHKKFNTKHSNFDSFCNKVVYFWCSEKLVLDYLRRKEYDTKEINTKISSLENFIMDLPGVGWAYRMYRYFTGNGSLSNDIEEEEITVFNQPMSLSEVPAMLHKYHNTKENTHMCGRLQTIDKINRNFNKAEREEAEKFDEMVIDDVVQIPDTYPLAAYYKIYIRSWRWSGSTYSWGYGRSEAVLDDKITDLLALNKAGKRFDPDKQKFGRSSNRMRDRYNERTRYRSWDWDRDSGKLPLNHPRMKYELDLYYRAERDMLVNKDKYYDKDVLEEVKRDMLDENIE